MASPYALLIAFHNLRMGRTYLIRLKRNPEIELLMTPTLFPGFYFRNYLFISGFAFLFVVGLRKYVIRLNNTFFIFDAVGLGLFTVVGIQKSIAVGYPMWVGIIMGTLTGAAGGMLRDVLLNEVPLIFRKDIYAIACICGGLIYYLCMYLDLPAAPTQFIAACSVILIRILAVRYGISLPALKGETRPAPKEK